MSVKRTCSVDRYDIKDWNDAFTSISQGRFPFSRSMICFYENIES